MDNSGLERRLNRLQIKLSSQEGASITYALLLFLVCATVSSVILAAGTAASGRISQSVESDQRYYAVTSAARLLKEIVEDYDVKIVKKTDDSTKQETYTEFYNFQEGSWNIYPPEDGSSVPVITIDAAEYYTKMKKPPESFPKYTMTVDGDEEGILKVDIIEKIDDQSGQISFEIKSTQGLSGGGTGGSENEPAFTMTMVFVPNIRHSIREAEEGTGASGGDTHKIKTETTSISWSLKSNGVTKYEASNQNTSSTGAAGAEPENSDPNIGDGSGA